LLNPQAKPQKNQITAACLQNGALIFGIYLGQTKQQITLPAASNTALHPVVAVNDG
jgi:hypothetical protein